MSPALWCQLALAVLIGAAGQVRPAAPAATAGTASIAGTVVDDRSGAPLRHAEVTIAGGTLERPAEINTNDAGQFRFEQLPAGRYSLYISANGFLRNELGAQRPGGPTVPIVVTAGEKRTGVIVRMVRGAVVTGRILDSMGEPVPRVAVALQQWISKSGERSLSYVHAPIVDTDDRGVYRIADVPPGEYVVMTTVEGSMGGLSMGPGVDRRVVATRAEVAAARLGVPLSGEAGALASLPSRALKQRTYYPGTARASDASMIAVATGEERTGIDFTVQYAPARTIRGRVVLPGVTPLQTALRLVSTTGASSVVPGRDVLPDGSFTIADVAPGDYVLTVQTFLPPAEASERWSAMLPVVVADRDLSDIVLTPSAGITVEGRVQFEGAIPAAERAKDLRIALTATVAAGEIVIGAPPVAIDANGRFKIGGVMPGRYSLALTSSDLSGSTPAGWWLKSASIGGRDAADALVNLSTNNVTDALAVVTERISTISGKLLDDAGEPVTGRRVVAFPANRALWTSKSRAIASAMAYSADGRFRVGPLPPGDYLIATASDLGDRDWLIPGVLDRLAAGAVRVTLAEGEQKILDLRARR